MKYFLKARYNFTLQVSKTSKTLNGLDNINFIHVYHMVLQAHSCKVGVVKGPLFLTLYLVLNSYRPYC